MDFEGANLSNADFSNSTITNEQSDLIIKFQGVKTKDSKII